MPVSESRPFDNPFNHDFVRVALCVPRVAVAEPTVNASRTVALLEQACQRRATIALFPELGLTAYSCDDLFQQQSLIDAARGALETVLDASRSLPILAVVGLPLVVDNLLYNCAAVLSAGRLLGVVPKTYLPGYREFYEQRLFAPAAAARARELSLCGQAHVPFGANLLFRLEEQPACVLHVEICEDLWVPIPPSSYACLAGATLLLNPSASNVTVGKDEYRKQLVGNQSARCLAAYAFVASGSGESTTDLAWDGHGLLYENGLLLAESQRFSRSGSVVVADVDLERLVQERMRQNSFGQATREHLGRIDSFRTVPVPLPLPRDENLALLREYERFPYVPSGRADRDERCEEVYRIQVHGLATRLETTGIDRVLVGVSGGLDSTHALIVAANAMDLLGRSRSSLIGCTMPGFATSSRTLDQARDLMRAVGCEALEIDIIPSCRQMLADIGHPFARGEDVHDVTFENVQAGERTNHLFRLANHLGGLVLGTGDLSELALGWQTYGVGDHMSHYAINASVPKTLIRHLLRWVAETDQLGSDTGDAIDRILTTEISPELVPGPANADGQPAQSTERILGPFELHDFFLYYALRFGFAPPKIAYLAHNAWGDRRRGGWPWVPEAERREYDLSTIKRVLKIFVERFFGSSQFKRSCMPNAPKVGSGGSLSPRGDWRAPSDGSAATWLSLLERIPERPAGE
jgi:NAD+ synthase (glutamine-hydrolysing)